MADVKTKLDSETKASGGELSDVQVKLDSATKASGARSSEVSKLVR